MIEELGLLSDYELLDSGDGLRLERFGDFILAKPDPAVLWQKSDPAAWENADAVFHKRGEERGYWQQRSKIPEKWLMKYQLPTSASKQIQFYAKLTPFKHTGVFPEQAANWNFICRRLAGTSGVKVLNLFGYTGIASVLCAALGADVTHVDASKPSISWAKENMIASGLPEDSIRWIFDDALKFVRREVKRGQLYDAIILDPPAFGRGPKGEVWKFNQSLPALLADIQKLISAEFRFLIVNAYAVSVSSLLLKNLLEDFNIRSSTIDYGELILKQKSGRLLSTGIFGRISR